MNELEAAIKAAKSSGKLLLDYYGKVSVEYKKDKSHITKADLDSEKNIKSILKEAFPSYAFLGEESGQEGESENKWIVDPLDGTTNFITRIPLFNVSIGLVKKDKPVLGVVYYPFQDELFYTDKSKAVLNGKKIQVSERQELAKSIHGFCHGKTKEHIEEVSRIFRLIKLEATNLRQFGSAAIELAYVACGRLDSFFMVGVLPWDVVAGVVLVEAAGGKVTDLSGKPFTMQSKTLIASNGKIHNKILDVVKV